MEGGGLVGRPVVGSGWRASMRSMRVAGSAALALSVFAGVAGPSPNARGHETDQYTLPLDKDFADVGNWLDATHCRALERAAADLNARIDEALRESDPAERARRLEKLHSQREVVDAVGEAFNDAFFEIIDVERVLRTDWARETWPDKITANWTMDWIYMYSHAWLDPRRLILLFQSSTIKAYGVYFGTDKLSHFHHMGQIYYGTWLTLRSQGLSDEEATARTIAEYSDGGSIGEAALLGYLATGVYSNADLASNYAGFRFFRNLTEPAMLKGRLCPPLMVLKDDHWRLSRHVRPESGWFGMFISDHWNEAFNPNIYDWTIRDSVHSLVKERSERIVTFYTKKDGRPDDPVYYERLAQELTTYYGEDYGHRGETAEIFTLANTCYPELVRLGKRPPLKSDEDTAHAAE